MDGCRQLFIDAQDGSGRFLKTGRVEKLAVDSRGEIQVFFESADKVGGAGKAAFCSDGVYGQGGFHDQFSGTPKAEGRQILMGRRTGLSFEDP